MFHSTRRIAYFGLVVMGLVFSGCSEPADSGAPQDMDDLARMLDPPKQETPPPPPAESEPPPPSRIAESEPAPPRENPQAGSADETAQQEPGGYLSSIAMAHRSIRTRVDDLAWKQAVSHFKANQGRNPRSHEEFMSGVIEALRIPLPELEPDEQYLYVPEEGQFGELYVVRPRP